MTPYTEYSYYTFNGETQIWHCNFCPKSYATIKGVSTHLGQHCKAAKKLHPNINKLLKAETNKRFNTSEKGVIRAAKGSAKYKKTTKGKITQAQAKYKKSIKGKITAAKAMTKYHKKHPEEIQAFLAACKASGRTSHRLTPAKRENQQISSLVSNDYGSIRLNWREGFEDFVESMLGRIYLYKLFVNVDSYFANEDSSAFNYVYFFFDTTQWTDEMTFMDVLRSIFYIGRGIGCRFIDHARETQPMLKNGITIDESTNPKEARIANIWSKNQPVKVVLLDFGKFAEKVDFFEFATTFAKGLDDLTNKKYDGYKSVPVGFSINDVFRVGMEILHRAVSKLDKAYDLTSDTDYGEKVTYKP